MVFFTPIFTLRKTKRLYVLTHGLQTQLPWQCVPTVQFLFMNLFLNRNAFTCRRKKEPILKKTDNDEETEEEHDLPDATSITLEEALEQAIKDENYELAARIRDQINSRNKNQ